MPAFRRSVSLNGNNARMCDTARRILLMQPPRQAQIEGADVMYSRNAASLQGRFEIKVETGASIPMKTSGGFSINRFFRLERITESSR